MRSSDYSHRMFQGLPEFMLYSVTGQPVMIITLPETQPAVSTERINLDDLSANLVIKYLKEHQPGIGQMVIIIRSDEENNHIIVRGNVSAEINSELTLEGVAALSVTRHLLNIESKTEGYSFDMPVGGVRCKVNALTDYNFGCRLESIPVKVIATDQEAGIPGIGLLKYDIVFADDLYILTDAKSLGITLSPEKLMLRRMEDYGQWILGCISANHKLNHPSTNIETMPAAVVFTGLDNYPVLLQAIVNKNGVISHSPGAGASCARLVLRHNDRNILKTGFIVRGLSGEQLSVMASEVIEPVTSGQETLSIILNVTLIQSGYLFI